MPGSEHVIRSLPSAVSAGNGSFRMKFNIDLDKTPGKCPWAARVARSPWFQRFILLMVLASCVTLCFASPLDAPNSRTNEILGICNIVFAGIFVMEMAVQMAAFGLWSNETYRECVEFLKWYEEKAPDTFMEGSVAYDGTPPPPDLCCPFGRGGYPQECVRREVTSEAAPAAVRQAVGGGCQSGWGRLLSVANAIEAGIWRQGDSGWA